MISSLATKADLADSHVATQAAIDTFRAEMQAAIKAVEADIATHRAEMQAALDTFRAEMQAAIKAVEADIATHRAETQAAIDLLRADLKAVKTDMATKSDLAALKAELFRVLWMLSLGLATVILTGAGVLLALFRMF